MRLKQIRYILLWNLFIFAHFSVIAQQEVQFTQYIFNTLSVNPAYAGYKEQWFVQLALRDQWSGLDGAPRTGQFSVDGILDPDTRNMGVGLQVTSDKLGPQASTSVYLNYAYRIRLNASDTKRLGFGLGAGLAQHGLNGSEFSPTDPDDAYLLYGNEHVWKWNMRLGAYYYSPRWYVGASLMDVLDRKESYVFNSDDDYYNIFHRKHFYFIGGAIFDMGASFKLRPSFLLKEDFKGPSSLDLNAMMIYEEKFWFGLGYRTGVEVWDKTYNDFSAKDLSTTNSISGIVQFYLSERFRIGYSYDYMLNDMENVQNGTHEITLGYTFQIRKKRLLSPRFF
ncbi:PorP/SprF family type IX secretion system membrane protein [Muricauda brasiliensis]|uniref:PorP/SprF family type IX secretion system membrane protein n=1 Tax=Muricauda brasiliensis TaxID=2162892 RepID=UPI000D3B533C|nr:type IX secretion system membrane protein PorP/SprF [Muricauda brasiliensis]